jgi:hypothetical protein
VAVFPFPFPLIAFRLSMGYQHHVKNLVKISMGQQSISLFFKGSTSTGLGNNFMLLHSCWLRVIPSNVDWLKKGKKLEKFLVDFTTPS